MTYKCVKKSDFWPADGWNLSFPQFGRAHQDGAKKLLSRKLKPVRIRIWLN